MEGWKYERKLGDVGVVAPHRGSLKLTPTDVALQINANRYHPS